MILLVVGCIVFLCIYIYTYYEAISKKLDTLQDTLVNLVNERERELSSRSFDYYG